MNEGIVRLEVVFLEGSHVTKRQTLALRHSDWQRSKSRNVSFKILLQWKFVAYQPLWYNIFVTFPRTRHPNFFGTWTVLRPLTFVESSNAVRLNPFVNMFSSKCCRKGNRTGVPSQLHWPGTFSSTKEAFILNVRSDFSIIPREREK